MSSSKNGNNRESKRRLKVLERVCRKTGGWATITTAWATGEGGIEADLRIQVGPCHDHPQIRPAQFRVRLVWMGIRGGEEVKTFDTWDDVYTRWREGQKRNDQAPEPHIYHEPPRMLCLGLEAEIRHMSEGKADVEKYVLNLLIPYLCRAQEVAEGRWSPGWDRPHNVKEGYKQLFGEWLGLQAGEVEQFLRRVHNGGIEDTQPCPCSSGLTYGTCHREGVNLMYETHRQKPVPGDWPKEWWPESWITGKTS